MKYTKKLLAITGLLSLFGGANAWSTGPTPTPSKNQKVTSYMHVTNCLTKKNLALISENEISSPPGIQGPGDYYIKNGESKQLEVSTPSDSSTSYSFTFALSAKGPQAPGACILEYDVMGSNQQTAFNLVRQADGSQGFICVMKTNHVYMIPA